MSKLGLLDALRQRNDNLPATFWFFANGAGPIGMRSAEGKSVLLLFKTRQDAEEAKVGLGIMGDLYDVSTLTKLAALFGTADNLGYREFALNTPPVPGQPLYTMEMHKWFKIIVREVRG